MLRSVLTLTLAVMAAVAYRVVWQGAAITDVDDTVAGEVTTLAVNGPLMTTLRARELPELASLSMTVERPLFARSRSRAEPPSEAPAPEVVPGEVAAPPVETPRFLLTAVFRAVGAELVLLHDPASGQVRSVRLGETLDGWRVETIEAQRVVLAKDGASHVLELREGDRSAASPVEATRPAGERSRLAPPGGTGVYGATVGRTGGKSAHAADEADTSQ